MSVLFIVFSKKIAIIYFLIMLTPLRGISSLVSTVPHKESCDAHSLLK